MLINPDNHYLHVLEDLKNKIHTARMQAAAMHNNHVLRLYWDIGRTIVQEQKQRGWGAKVINELSKDLRSEFPDFKGLSPRNLRYMRDFAKVYPDDALWQQAAAKVPLFHFCTLLSLVKDETERQFYAAKTIEQGWSREVMAAQIKSGYIHGVGKAITNFAMTLPPSYSDLARETLKNPYTFGFLSLEGKIRERDLEQALLDRITHFLLELGSGFAFVGKQKLLEVGGDEFFPDLVFYHIPLRCYFIIDLKMKKFKPEYTGKMNFYLTTVDKQLKLPSDNPSSGCSCANKPIEKYVAEYALQDINKPIGVSTYHFSKSLPDAYKAILPTVEALEKKIGIGNVASQIEIWVLSEIAKK